MQCENSIETVRGKKVYIFFKKDSNLIDFSDKKGIYFHRRY